MAKIKVTKSVGMLLLGIWLILTRLIPVLKLNFSGFPVIMEVLAIAAGISSTQLDGGLLFAAGWG